MRVPVVAGNWKMNKTAREAVELIEEIKPLVKDAECEVVVCVPATDIYHVSQAIAGSNIKLGAQNVHAEASGAFTGEISADMLLEFGVEYVIIGHSERRCYYGETNRTVNLRTQTALNRGLKPIVCVGETLSQRHAGKTNDVLEQQLFESLYGIRNFENTIVAYEPIWAIGTGQTPTSREANENIAFIRKTLRKLHGDKLADEIRILYGGSVLPTNAAEIFAMNEIDGGLIGGASLKAESFAEIVHSTK
ncbi:MAG: triose-phosphate isomerase [Christensenellaceae bacterium]